MILRRDEDAKSEVTTDKEKENISTISSIFQNIKHSEDVVDTSKSKVVDKYIFICDIVENCKSQIDKIL